MSFRRLILPAIAAIIVSIVATVVWSASPPPIITYQGKVLVSGSPASTTLPMQFTIYNALSGGTALYTASGSTSSPTNITITTTQGLFTVYLGDNGTNPINPEIFKDNEELYLQVTIDTEVLTPRKRLASSPYALNAKYLDGNFATSTPTTTKYIPISDTFGSFEFNNITSTNIYVTGNVSSTAFTLNGSTITAWPTGGSLPSGASGQLLVHNGSDWIASNTFTTTTIVRDVLPDMTGGTGNVSLYSLGNTTSRFAQGWFENIYLGSSTWKLGQDGSGNLNIFNNGTSNGLVIASNGNAGVGSANTSTKFLIDNPQHEIELINDNSMSSYIDTSNDIVVIGNYAYTVGANGFQIWDISDKTAPFLYSATSSLMDGNIIEVSNDATKAFVWDGPAGGLKIFDISNPLNIVEAFYAPANVQAIKSVGNNLYLAMGNSKQEFTFVDVSDPYDPTPMPPSNIELTNWATNMDVVGNFAYVAEESVLEIINMSSWPSVVTTTITANSRITDIDVVNNYAYVADTNAGLRIFDITSPLSPTEVGSIISVHGPVYRVKVVGDYAYLAIQNSGIEVVNISDPINPNTQAFYDTNRGTGFLPPQNIDVDNDRYIYVDAPKPTIILRFNPYSGDPIPYAAIFNGGKVGIGTMTPGQNLSVVGNIGVTKGLYLGRDSKPLNVSYSLYTEGGQLYWDGSPVGGGGSLPAGNYGDTIYNCGGGWCANNNFYNNGTNLSINNSGSYDSDAALTVNKYWYQDKAMTVYGGIQMPDGYGPSVAANTLYNNGGTLYWNGSALSGGGGSQWLTNGNNITNNNSGKVIVGTNQTVLGMTPESITTMPGSGQRHGIFVTNNTLYYCDQATGLRIYNLNSTTPDLISSYNYDGGMYTLKNVYVSGKYAYLTYGYFFVIVDISNPNNPVYKSVSSPFGNWNSYIDVVVEGKYAYFVGGDGFRVADISDPTSPTIVQTISSLNEGFDIKISGNYAYIADGSSGLKIFDIKDVNNIFQVGSYPSGETMYAVNIKGDYAFIADGLSSGSFILNIKDKTNPTFVSNLGVFRADDIIVNDNYVFVAASSAGVIIFNIENVNSPTQIAVIADYNSWGLFVYGTRLFVQLNRAPADQLYIYQLQGLKANSAKIATMEVDKLSVFDNADFNGKVSINNSLVVGRGGLISQGPIQTGYGLYINPATPATVSNALYNVAGTLYWNGSAVGGGGGSLPSGSTGQLLVNSGGSSWSPTNTIFVNSSQGVSLGEGNSNSGISSIAGGISNTVTGYYGSFAFGQTNSVGGNYGSGALGIGNNVTGNYGATAIGYSNFANSANAIAIGYNNFVNNSYSYAFGQRFTINARDSMGFNVSSTLSPVINSSNIISLMGGNVGIGTTDPGKQLVVAGNSLFTEQVQTGYGLLIDNNTPAITSNALYNVAGTLYWNGSAVGGGGGSLPSGVVGQTLVNAGGSTWNPTSTLFVNASGVSIGLSTTTGRLLSVHGDAVINNQLISNQEGGLYFGRTKITENIWNISSTSIWATSTQVGSVGMWKSIAISSDGKYQSAVSDQIYISYDYGRTWVAKESLRNWKSIAISSDGKYQTAVSYESTGLGPSYIGRIYISSNYGQTWTARMTDLSRYWASVSMSADGKYQTAVNSNGRIYTSSNYGSSWTLRDSDRGWFSVAISSDGKYQTAVAWNNYIYVSTDYGVTWSTKSNIDNRIFVAMSSDGKYQTTIVSGGQIYTSSDFGENWTARDNSRSWQSVAVSADGKQQSAVVNGGNVYISDNFGLNWYSKDTSRNWQSIAMSSDGKYQTAGVNGGYLYITIANSYSYGNIGINTTTPNKQLVVAGNSLFTDQIQTSLGLIIDSNVPAFTSNALYNSGGTLYWNGSAVGSGGSGTPGGSDGEVQFNNSGSFGATSSFFWDKVNGRLGIGTSTPGFKLTMANDGGILAIGNGDGLFNQQGADLNVTGTGTRMIWYPKKGAFRAGGIVDPSTLGFVTNNNIDQWDDVNIGALSFAANLSNVARGGGSSAFGIVNNALGDVSFVGGGNNTSSGFASLAFGLGNISSATSSAVFGTGNESSGENSFAVGWLNTASGKNSFVGGTYSSSIGEDSFAYGQYATAYGARAFSLGSYTQAATGSVAIGSGSISNPTWASGLQSVAIGSPSQASGYQAVAIGYGAGGHATGSIALGNVGIRAGADYSVGLNASSSLFNMYTPNVIALMGGNVGVGTTSPTSRLTIDNDGGILAVGTFNSGNSTLPSGAGTRMLWYPRKAAFRAGGVSDTSWNESNIGSYSVAFGYNNSVPGAFSTISGGSGNESNSAYIFVGGGYSQSISGNSDYSVIVGGFDNSVYQAPRSFIGGGTSNTAAGENSFIGGGFMNRAFTTSSVVVGGESNTASGTHASVLGGYNNFVSGMYAAVGGGQSNSSTGNHSFIGGGYNNIATGDSSFIGGRENSALGQYSFVGGGYKNIASGTHSAVFGINNQALGSESFVIGERNTSSAFISFVSGWYNEIEAGGDLSFIAGGRNSKISTQNSAIIGGAVNIITGGSSAFIGGSSTSTISGSQSAIIGGREHIIDANASFIGGGFGNNISSGGNYSFIGGGWNNAVAGTSSFVAGGLLNNISGEYSFIGAGDGSSVTGLNSVAFGRSMTVNGDRSFGVSLSMAGGTIDEDNTMAIMGGRVGIGTTTPSTTLFVQGTSGGSSAWVDYSDERLKTNIVTIENALSKVLSLRGVNFEWKNPENDFPGVKVGLIAQEVKEIVPEVVNEIGGVYGIQYAPLTALLVEAIKDQQNQIESLKNASTTLTVENTEGQIVYTVDMGQDMLGRPLLNVASIIGANNKWEIDTNGTLITKVTTASGIEKKLYGMSSENAEITLSGTSTLENGEARIIFTSDIQEIIDETQPIKVIFSLTSPCNKNIYVSEKSKEGFVLKMVDGNESGITFDWMVLVKRKFSDPFVEEIILENGSEESTTEILDETETNTSTEEIVESINEEIPLEEEIVEPVVEETLVDESETETESPETSLENPVE